VWANGLTAAGAATGRKRFGNIRSIPRAAWVDTRLPIIKVAALPGLWPPDTDLSAKGITAAGILLCEPWSYSPSFLPGSWQMWL
jgi:hypothetical protein